MIGYIVPVGTDLYVAIVISSQESDKPIVYRNTHPQKREEIESQAKEWENTIFNDQIPKEIEEIATKIALITQGFDQDTSNIILDYADYTEKQKQVIQTAMKIPVNEIWPYSRVAEEAGLPKAQRFVGTTMRVSRHPYIVPVQRVKSISYIRKKDRKSKRNYNKMPL